MVRTALAELLSRLRRCRTIPADKPEAALLLDVDREYRAKAANDELRKIAPKRFNLSGAVWLPILHTTRRA